MRSLIALILLGLVTLPAHAEATLSLRWPSGGTDLRPRDAEPCTLGVHGLPTLPQRWHLAWRSDQPLEMLRPDPEARVPEFARACGFATPASIADQLSNLYSTQHCGETAAGEVAAYYVFSCPAGVCARFRLYSVSEDGAFTVAAEATLNGGFSGTLPCVVESVAVSTRGDTLIVSPNRGFLHRSLGASGAAGPLRSELAARRHVTSKNAAALGVADGTYDCDVYRMVGTAGYGVTLLATPRIWSRSSGAGWDSVGAFDYDTLTACAAVVGTPGLEMATLKTFVYHLRNSQGAFFAWVPVDTVSARSDLTVAGVLPWDLLAVEEEAPVARLAASPSPVVTTALITYSLAVRGPVRIGVWDVMGREVAVLVDGLAAAGVHQATWDLRTQDGRHCPAGVYFVRSQAGGTTLTRKIVVLGR